MEKISGQPKDGYYQTNIKALRRWSEERLQLTYYDNGSIEAKFLYEGTTCSNFGHPLAYKYLVKLSSSGSDSKIEEMHCEVVEGDVGHRKMCEYIRDHKHLKLQIEHEKPLLGKSLAEVFEWSRPFSPEGCYCKYESRMHKWGIVLETIHYALAHRENSIA